MKKRKRSRIPSRTLYCFQKRLLAFLLAAAMILANVGADTNQVYAASSSESVTFSVGGSQLIKAIEDAIVNGEEVTAEDLDFTNGKIAEFKELFFGKGKIYEAFPELDGEGVDAQLRVFVRIPENADDMYMVTGDEEIVFLYVNNGDNTISCSTEITRMDNGVEKVKKTNRITVRSYESAFGKEEVNVVTKPDQPTVTGETKVPEKATPAEAGKAVETAPVKETTAAEETTSVPEETTSAPETPSKLPEETIAAPAESQTESPAEESVKEAAEPEEVPVSESNVSEPVASIIRHNAPIVAAKENGEVTETAEVSEETAAVDPENVRESKETEAPANAETKQVETKQVETTQVETPKAESTQAETSQIETTQSETTQPETTQAPATASPSETKPVPETPNSETKASPAGTADLVGIGYCSTAKAYTVTINQLKALEDYDGYKISYTINPEASARIIEGPRGVEEGQELTFGVKNQIGYGIESVTANGQTLKSESETDNTDGSKTAWYSVSEIYEDQEVEVHMSETGEHPEFSSQLVMEDGTVIRLHAPEGVLPAGVKASAVVVTGIGDAVKEKVEAQSKEDGEAKEVISSLSYNIDLLDRSGNKLDNQIWNGSVQVTFSGTPMENHSREANTVEVVYVATTKEDEPQAKVTAADVASVEPVSEEVNVQENKGINEITFEAEHFSTYTIVFSNFWGSKRLPLNLVKYDNGAVIPIGTDGIRSDSLSFGKTVSMKEVAPEVSGYTFDKATVGSDFLSGSQIQSLRCDDGLWDYTIYYKTSSSKWTDLEKNSIYLWYSEKGITVQFDANGGQGSVSSKIAKPGDSIELPDGSSLTRANYKFMGWSDSPDGGKITSKGNAGYNEVYTDTFTLDANDTGKPKILYAVWAQTGGSASGRLWVAVLNDGGDLPAEPRNQTSRSYEFIYKDYGQYFKTIGSGDNLLNYINPLITVTGKDNVQANLNDKFYQVTASWEAKNLKKNEYIEWYVIKYESAACGTEGWHVDGIIRNKESYYVDYVGNGNTGGLTPDGQGYDLNANVTVAKAGGYEGATWLPLKKDGYVFNGWNTRPDGKGAAFNEGDSFSLTKDFIAANHSGADNTVTLYAQWRLKNSVQIKFQAVGEGNVSPANEYLNPDIGVSKGAVATPNKGYKLSGWYSDAACTVLVSASARYTPERPAAGWGDGTTFYARFVVDDTQKFGYTVNYYIKGTTAAVPGLVALTGSAPVGTFTWKNEPKTATGYKLVTSPTQPTSMTITADGSNEQTVYYEIDETQKFNYTVNYFVKGTTTPVPGLSALTGSAPVGTFTWKNEPVTTTGYKLVTSSQQPTSMTITATGPNVQTVYYEIDETQKFGYTVNYYIKGTTTAVPGLESLKGKSPIGTFTWSNVTKTATGYKLVTSSPQPTSMTITAAGPNQQTVYYEVDDTQKFNYTVNYYINGTTAVVPGLKALTGSAPVGTFTWKNKAKTATGYKLMAEQPISMTITSTGPNVQTVYYETDETQKFSYTVNYYIKGTTTAVPGLAPLSGSAPVGTFTWSNVTKTETGYKLVTSSQQPTSMTITADGLNEKTVYYEIDETQKFGYTVNYYIKGTSTTVPGLTPQSGSAPVGEFSWRNEPKTETGYKLMAGQPESMTITAAGPNVKVVYYEVDKAQTFGYTVNYYIKNTTTAVPGLTPLTGSASVGGFSWRNEPKTETGYKLMAGQPNSMTITAAGPNVRTVYYEIDETQKFGYTVNYLIKGSTVQVPGLKALSGKAPVGVYNWVNAPKTETGYKLMAGQPTSMIITAAGSNVRTVYYEIDETQKFDYTVNYYIKGTTTAVPGLTALSGKEPVGEFSWRNEPKTDTGYRLMIGQPESMTITSSGPNAKAVYYEIDDTQKFDYTVNFYIKYYNSSTRS
ncbi:InlB B-repeat-containing protein [Lacrimispora xylanisolvens]|uniref:InlB B-repeat-containing protein n=1 Tax=Lacrimispora xylanisolvens TaxID=384636 RepID=UPI002402D930